MKAAARTIRVETVGARPSEPYDVQGPVCRKLFDGLPRKAEQETLRAKDIGDFLGGLIVVGLTRGIAQNFKKVSRPDVSARVAVSVGGERSATHGLRLKKREDALDPR